MEAFNRVIWIAIFLLGTGVLTWLEWRGGDASAMAWFMFTSLWSAVCGISYTVMHWFIVERTHRDSC